MRNEEQAPGRPAEQTTQSNTNAAVDELAADKNVNQIAEPNANVNVGQAAPAAQQQQNRTAAIMRRWDGAHCGVLRPAIVAPALHARRSRG